MMVEVESSDRAPHDSAVVANRLEPGTSARNHKPAHIPALDGLRGLAILLVIFSHTTVMVPVSTFDRAYFELVDCGWMGVDLFFVLSGFLITGILFESKESPHYFRNFYMRRVLRIFPLYYLFLILMLVVVPHLPNAKLAAQGKVAGSAMWYWVYASNIRFLLHGFDSQVLSVTWSLAVEEHFYLVWPLVVLTLSRRSLLWVCGGIAAAALMLRICFVLAGAPGVIPYTFTLCRMDSLAIGAAIALTARGSGGLAWLRSWSLWIAPSAAGGVAILCILGKSTFWNNGWLQSIGYSVISGFFAAALIIILTSAPGSRLRRVFSSRALRTFGKYSYCLYLVHALFRSGIRDRIYKPQNFLSIAGSRVPGQFIFYAMTIGVSLLGAMLSWKFVETPFLRLKRLFPAHEL